MRILHAKLLVKHFKIMYRDLFCTKFDPNNYKYCDVKLQTKYRLGIMQEHFSKNSFKLGQKMTMEKPLLKCMVIKIPFKSKIT